MSNPPAYEVAHREMLAEVPGLRVVVLTLAPGQYVPWHYHSEITDSFICLEGPMVIETGVVQAKSGRTQTELAPGETLAIPPRKAHRVSGKDGGACEFAIVQGPGSYDFVPVGDELDNDVKKEMSEKD